MRNVVLGITLLFVGMLGSNVYAVSNEEAASKALQIAELWNKASDIADSCTANSLYNNGEIPSDCKNYLVELHSAMQPIINKYYSLSFR